MGGEFYPAKLKPADYLTYYATQFDSGGGQRVLPRAQRKHGAGLVCEDAAESAFTAKCPQAIRLKNCWAAVFFFGESYQPAIFKAICGILATA